MNNELLVKSIRNLCKENNIPISQLESELKFGAGLISRWSKSSPSLDKIIDIAQYFHVSLDEVIGYNNSIDDQFLKILIDKTINHEIIWEECEDIREKIPKEHYEEPPTSVMFDSESDFLEYINAFKESFYYSGINGGYVIIYAQYFNQEIMKPNILKLFIQPSDDSKLIYQMYNLEQLSKLWLKILYNLNESTPDEIKAENFKNEFINVQQEKHVDTKNQNIDFKNIDKIMSSDQFKKIQDFMSSQEFKNLETILESKEFNENLKAIQKMKMK